MNAHKRNEGKKAMKQEFNMELTVGEKNAQTILNIKTSVEFDPVTDQSSLIKAAFAGQSARVNLQAQLRTWDLKELRKLEVTGLNTTLAAIMGGTLRVKKGAVAPKDAFKAALKAKPREEAVQELIEMLGVTEEQAAAFLDKI